MKIVLILSVFCSLAMATDCRKDDGSYESADGGCRHADSGVVWDAQKHTDVTYARARDFCSRIGGHGDWKLPSIKALETLSKDALFNPLNMDIDGKEWYWAESGAPLDGGVATFVNLKSGETETNVDMTKVKGAVVCARTRPSSHTCRDERGNFATANGGCEDPRGTVWSLPSATAMNTVRAETYCDNLREGGKSDWRLPGWFELDYVAQKGAKNTFRFDTDKPFASVFYKWGSWMDDKCIQEADWFQAEPQNFCQGRYLVSLRTGRVGSFPFRTGVLWGGGKYTDFDALKKTPFPLMCVRGKAHCTAGIDTTGKSCGIWDAKGNAITWFNIIEGDANNSCTKRVIRSFYGTTLASKCSGSVKFTSSVRN